MTRARTDLVDAFAGVLSGVVAMSGELRSESAVARRIDTEGRLLQDLRRTGLLAPRRLGRGYVYSGADIRTASVLVALIRLGATAADLVALFSAGGDECLDCPGARAPDRCAAATCCATFLERLCRRTEDEIARLHMLDGLLVAYAADAVGTAAPRRPGGQ